MSDLRTDMIEAMRTALSGHYQDVPGEVPISVPLGKFADAALNLLTDGRPIPKIPEYRHDVALERRWSGLTHDLAEAPPASIQVHNDEGLVVVRTYLRDNEIVLPLQDIDAVDLALNLYSAATAPAAEPAAIEP